MVADLTTGTHYRGVVERITFDQKGEAWMGTTQVLYRVADGQAQAMDAAPTSDRQLALSPGGGVYAWLARGRAPAGLFTVELMEIPKKSLAELRLPEPPFGFGALFLGGTGGLIVTATPLDNQEGLEGRFLYVFWSRDGRILSRVTLEGPRLGVVDVNGDALLLLGPADALAFRNDGRQLWRLDGRYRKASLAAKGRIALLNPAAPESLDEVHVFRNGKVTRLTMPAPVYEFALTGNGALAAVGIGTGAILFVEPRSCNTSTCKPPRPAAGIAADASLRITSLGFVDASTLAVGRILRVGEAPAYSYPEGRVLVVPTFPTTTNEPPFEVKLPLAQPATWAPMVDVTYGRQTFGAHTTDRAVVVSLAP